MIWNRNVESTDFNQSTYDEAIYRIVPVMTIEFQYTTGNVYSLSSFSQTHLTCMRAKNIQAGSRKPPQPLPLEAATGTAVTTKVLQHASAEIAQSNAFETSTKRVVNMVTTTLTLLPNHSKNP